MPLFRGILFLSKFCILNKKEKDYISSSLQRGISNTWKDTIENILEMMKSTKKDKF